MKINQDVENSRLDKLSQDMDTLINSLLHVIEDQANVIEKLAKLREDLDREQEDRKTVLRQGLCRNLCVSLPHPRREGNTHYSYGDRFCERCRVWFFKGDNIYCECCSTKLRVKGRNN